MAIEAGDFKTGLTLLIDGEIWQVLDFQHVKPGKGAAILRTKMKNLRNGSVLERNFNTNTKFETAMVDKREVQYSYASGDTYSFMDMETYESYDLNKDQIGDGIGYLIEGSNIFIKLFEGEIIGVELPEKVTLQVTETTEAVSGAKSTDQKDAVLETGIMVKVPMFIKNGEKIVVNTNDGKYSGRA